MALKRCTPRISSRTTSSDHFSPITSSAPATEQIRGAASRTGVLTGTSSQKRVGKSNPVGYRPSSRVGNANRLRSKGPRHDRHAGRRLQRPADHRRTRHRRAGCRQARPAGPALRRHRLPAGDPGRRSPGAAGRRAARTRDRRRGQGQGHLLDDAGGKALQPDRQRARWGRRDLARHGHGLRLAHPAPARHLVHDARHQRALPPGRHPRHRTGACRRNRRARRAPYGDRRRPRDRADVRSRAGDEHVDTAGRPLVTTTASASVSAPPTREPSQRVVLIVLSLAAFMASLDLFIVNVAFPEIAQEFNGASLGDVSWILNGYAVLYAALLVPLGRLADRYGRLAGFLLGLSVFTAASAACAVSQDLWTLVAFRGVQAIGAAALTPASLGLLLAATAPERRVRAVRSWAAVGTLAAAAGPVIGGLLVQASWRWVFLVNVPVGLLGLVVARRYVPDSRDLTITKVPDLLGALLVAIGIGAVALGMVKGPEWGWDSTGVLTSFAIAAVSLVGFWMRSAVHPRPVVELALLRVRAFAWANVTAVLFSATFGAGLLAAVLWLQGVWHWSALRTGLAIAPGPLMVPVFTAVAQRLSGRVPAGVLTAIGSTLFGAGTLLIALSVGAQPSYAADFLPGWLIAGVGVGFAFPTIISAATADLPPARAATGSAIVTMARQIGLVIGVSGFVALLGTPHGFAAVHAAYRTAWLVLAAVSLSAAVSALGMTPRRDLRNNQPTAV